jgi:site-specific recombinase XerC
VRWATGWHDRRSCSASSSITSTGRGESRITVQAALDWARLPAGGDSNWWAFRLSVVRGFASYLHALDPAHEVPASDVLPQRSLRASPYLYSDTDIAALIAATNSLRTPLRRATFATLIGLLTVTGMRVGEAIAVDRGDVDLAWGGCWCAAGGQPVNRRPWVRSTSSPVSSPNRHNVATPRPITTAIDPRSVPVSSSSDV